MSIRMSLMVYSVIGHRVLRNEEFGRAYHDETRPMDTT